MIRTIVNSQRLSPASIAVLLVAATALSACGEGFRDSFRNKRTSVAFDGFVFKAKAKEVSKDARDHFTVSVSRVNQSLNGARQAGAHEAVKYCISEYGTSNVEWVVGPENEGLIPVDDKIQLEGFCRP